MRVLPTGMVEVVTGTAPHGQGHETCWSMIVADSPRHPDADHVEVLHSDTAISPLGLDTYGSRSLAVGGNRGVPRVRQGRREGRAPSPPTSSRRPRRTSSSSAASSGCGHTGTGACRSRPIAFEAFTAHNLPDARSSPTSTADASYDPRTSRSRSASTSRSSRSTRRPARVELVRYVAVDDCGNQVNPLIVEGQVHGGVVQGVAQALWEEAVYDDDGNLLHREPARLPRAVGRRGAEHRARPPP